MADSPVENAIRQRWVAAGKTANDLAVTLDVTPAHARSILRGDAGIRAKYFRKLATALGCSVGELMADGPVPYREKPATSAGSVVGSSTPPSIPVGPSVDTEAGEGYVGPSASSTDSDRQTSQSAFISTAESVIAGGPQTIAAYLYGLAYTLDAPARALRELAAALLRQTTSQRADRSRGDDDRDRDPGERAG